MGIVSRSKQGKAYLFSFNYIIWPELKDFVTALLEYRVLRLVPREALLIKSYDDNVIFKSLRPQDATFTSFSAYEDYGILLGLRDNYYTLPKRELSIQDIFVHSLDSAWESSQKLFCVLFYLKNRDRLERIDHPMMKDLKAVLQGGRDSEAIQPWKISKIGQISMISNSDKISRKEEINELFEQLIWLSGPSLIQIVRPAPLPASRPPAPASPARLLRQLGLPVGVIPKLVAFFSLPALQSHKAPSL